MTGLDNMMYMSSQSTNTGQATVTLTFEAGTDPNEAMQQVQNQLQAAIKRLPQAVQNQGVTVSKSGDTTLMMVAFVSTDNSMDKQGHRRLHRLQPAGSAQPHQRRRQHGRVRLAIRHAHLARSQQAQ